MHMKEGQNARPQHREHSALLFVNSVWVLYCPTELFTNKGCETGSPAYGPYLGRLKTPSKIFKSIFLLTFHN